MGAVGAGFHRLSKELRFGWYWRQLEWLGHKPQFEHAQDMVTRESNAVAILWNR